MEPQIQWRVPGPLGAQNKLPKLISIIVKDPSAVFSVWTVKDFQFQVALTPGRQLEMFAKVNTKNPGYLVEIFCLKCTNLKGLLTRLLQRKIVSSYVCCTIAFIKIRYTKDNNEEIRNEEAFCPCLALHNPPRPCTACILTTPKEN